MDGGVSRTRAVTTVQDLQAIEAEMRGAVFAPLVYEDGLEFALFMHRLTPLEWWAQFRRDDRRNARRWARRRPKGWCV